MNANSGVVHYLYWSDRRIQQFLDHNNAQMRPSREYTIGANLPGVTGTIKNSSRPWSRDEIALSVERSLGSSLISVFDDPHQILFAKGKGTVILGEFVGINGGDLGTASVLASTQNSDDTRTAICLFGSIANFTDYVSTDRTPSWRREGGWTSSAAPYIKRFLEEACSAGVEFMTREELASAALNVLLKQGTHQSFNGDTARSHLPWNRQFTYGDVQSKAEWCAQIHYDVLVRETSEYRDNWEGYHRVLIGAPLWVRTRNLRALRLYCDYDAEELDREAGYGAAGIRGDSEPQGRLRTDDDDSSTANSIGGTEMELGNADPWSNRTAAWALDLIIAVVMSTIIGRSASAFLDWPSIMGWIIAIVLSFSYWPFMTAVFRATAGQHIAGIRPILPPSRR